MIVKSIVVNKSCGKNMLPACKFVNIVNHYKSDVKMIVDGREYSIKSLLNFLSASVGDGDKIKIIVDGSDEKEALEAIETALVEGLED